jgi:hypothetical protein
MFGDWKQTPMSAGPFAFTANTAGVTMAIGPVEGTSNVESVVVLNSAAIATHATNYITFSLINLGTAGTGTTVVASASTSQTGGAAVVAQKPFTLSITAANKEVSDGQVLGLNVKHATTDASAVAMGRVHLWVTQTGPTSA